MISASGAISSAGISSTVSTSATGSSNCFTSSALTSGLISGSDGLVFSVLLIPCKISVLLSNTTFSPSNVKIELLNSRTHSTAFWIFKILLIKSMLILKCKVGSSILSQEAQLSNLFIFRQKSILSSTSDLKNVWQIFKICSSEKPF